MRCSSDTDKELETQEASSEKATSAPTVSQHSESVNLSLNEQQEIGSRLRRARKSSGKSRSSHSTPLTSKWKGKETGNKKLEKDEQRRKVLEWSLESALQLPSNSAYAKHRINCIRKALSLLSSVSEGEVAELESLLQSLNIN